VILVIEGPSAVGKTTLCRAHSPNGFVEEARENQAAPDLYADPAEVAQFWSNFNINLWQTAERLERKNGIAVCDGDPFHFYFSWSLWKAGLLPSTLFEIELPLYRRAFQEGRLGFADRVCWREAPEDELRRRAKSDPFRKRRRHETYLKLVPWMRTWFAIREQVLPGTVRAWPDRLDHEVAGYPAAPAFRYDVKIFDQMIDRLAAATAQTDSGTISAPAESFRSLPQ